MSKGKKLWPAGPHTLAKIDIVREYLKAWLPKLATAYDEVVYFDGFSGPGRYSGGEPGSPIVALETTINHRSSEDFKCVRCFFVEKDELSFNHLKDSVERYLLPSNVKVRLCHGKFDDALTKYLDWHRSQRKNLFPTFLFVDPFGISGVKLSTLKRFIAYPRCEFLLNFNINSVRRFCEHPHFNQHLREIYGDNSWETCITKDSVQERSACLSEVFENKISGLVEFKWRFDMYDNRNQLQYYLFYGTNNIVGLEVMKNAMWATSPGRFYKFRSKDGNQISCLEDLLDFDDVADKIYYFFRGKTARIEDIEGFVLIGTEYMKAHTKRALRKIEERGLFKRVSSRRQRYSYPPGTEIEFF